MKIVHLCLGNYYADNYGYQENLITKYHKLDGHEVVIIASLQSYDQNGNIIYKKPSTYINSDGIKVIRLDYKKIILYKKLKFYKKLFNVLIQEQPDIIFIHDFQFFDIKNVIKYKKKYSNIKIYVDNHNDIYNSAKNIISKYILHKIIWKSFATRLTKYVEMYYGVLPARVDFLHDFYNIPYNKIRLLPFGIDDFNIPFSEREKIRCDFREKYNIKNNDFLFVTGGRLDKRKKIDILATIFLKYKKNNEKLLIFGNPVKEMEDEFKKIDDPSIIKIGWIDLKDIYKVFFAGDLAIFPSTHSTLWEYAVGCGIPCAFKKQEGFLHINVNNNVIFLNELNDDEIIKLLSICRNNESYTLLLDNANKKNDFFYYSNISRKAINNYDNN